MKVLKFKTSINCNDCVSKVSPYLDKVDNIKNWEVQTSSPEKLLTVRGQNLDAKEIMKVVKRAGFKLSLIGERVAARV